MLIRRYGVPFHVRDPLYAFGSSFESRVRAARAPDRHLSPVRTTCLSNAYPQSISTVSKLCTWFKADIAEEALIVLPYHRAR